MADYSFHTECIGIHVSVHKILPETIFSALRIICSYSRHLFQINCTNGIPILLNEEHISVINAQRTPYYFNLSTW